ncbi:MAG: ABC transporter ATP-binding protein [Bacteroidota bacterium]
MRIKLESIGKRFNDDWIFRNLNYTFASGTAYVILGANGSGKSTLLQLIAGSALPSSGNISYSNGHDIDPGSAYRHIGFCAPYLDLLEEYTLAEQLRFHQGLKKFRSGLEEKKITGLCGLEHSANKQLKYFSSGMKQRVRLALAILSDTPALLLDEPLSNLDAEGVEWYKGLIAEHTAGRLVIVCSNHYRSEFGFCTEEIRMENYKR